ncbi:Lipopolysaccharide-induced tumor necrosis factor-alpha factor -like protein [Halotydeus destructor]|nr:Lipopolysaccharide-induced tumor necrosis factor-alpha factor -like protein [Halotydeus destructor]
MEKQGYAQVPGQPTAPGFHDQGQPQMQAQPAQMYVVVDQPKSSPYPMPYNCPNCSKQGSTETTPVSGALTWLASAAICFLGGALGCCLIPFCTSCCRDVEHRCPNCKNYVSTHKRIC